MDDEEQSLSEHETNVVDGEERLDHEPNVVNTADVLFSPASRTEPPATAIHRKPLPYSDGIGQALTKLGFEWEVRSIASLTVLECLFSFVFLLILNFTSCFSMMDDFCRTRNFVATRQFAFAAICVAATQKA